MVFHRKNEDHDHVDEMLHHAAFHLGDSCLAKYKRLKRVNSLPTNKMSDLNPN